LLKQTNQQIVLLDIEAPLPTIQCQTAVTFQQGPG